MDINDIRGLATVLCMVAFVAIIWWAYGPSRKDYFDEAAQIPFEDEVSEGSENSDAHNSGYRKEEEKKA